MNTLEIGLIREDSLDKSVKSSLASLNYNGYAGLELKKDDCLFLSYAP